MKLLEHRLVGDVGDVGGIEQIARFVKIERFEMDMRARLETPGPIELRLEASERARSVSPTMKSAANPRDRPS